MNIKNSPVACSIAIEHATGEFLIFIDADDFLHPNALIYAKQMIEDNGLERNVFKFGISKTNLDKTSTLNTNKRDSILMFFLC